MENNDGSFDPTNLPSGDESENKPFDPAAAMDDDQDMNFGEQNSPQTATVPLGQEKPKIQPLPPQPSTDALRDASLGGLKLSSEALLVKEKLAKEPKMVFMVPFDQGELPGAYRAVTINGYRCEVKKGVMVELPMSIAKLLMNSYNIENAVQANHPLNLANRGDSVRRVLS